MHSEQSAMTIIVVGAKRPNPQIQKEIGAHGISLQWARTIKGAAGLLKCAFGGGLVVTELTLRDGDWKDLLETVRRIDKSIPILLVSSTSTAELWWDALECGVEDILVGPLSASRLCDYLWNPSTTRK